MLVGGFNKQSDTMKIGDLERRQLFCAKKTWIRSRDGPLHGEFRPPDHVLVLGIPALDGYVRVVVIYSQKDTLFSCSIFLVD